MYLILTMNNTKSILFIATITLLLIMGTTIIPVQSYADRDNDENKKYNDNNPKTSASSQTDKKSASQHQDQDNVCYRGNETCTQANQGQETIGKDNKEFGFNDQSINVQQSTTTTTPTQPPTPGPTPTILNVCKEVTNTATTNFEPSDFLFNFDTPANPDLFRGANVGCTAVTVDPGTYHFEEFLPAGITAVSISASGDCAAISMEVGFTFGGTIAAGETQTCTISNTITG